MFGKKKKTLSEILGMFETTAVELEDLIDERQGEILTCQEQIEALEQQSKAASVEIGQANRAMKNIRKIIE